MLETGTVVTDTDVTGTDVTGTDVSETDVTGAVVIEEVCACTGTTTVLITGFTQASGKTAVMPAPAIAPFRTFLLFSMAVFCSLLISESLVTLSRFGFLLVTLLLHNVVFRIILT
jgi:hypothetical protein